MYIRVGHAEKCQFALTPGTGTRASLDTCITCDVGAFLGDGGRGGQGSWPFTTYVFCGVKGINC